MLLIEQARRSIGANVAPPPATTDEGTPDMALRSLPRQNGIDLADEPEPNFDERLGRMIRQHWKWAFGILLTAGFICLPASVWQLRELAATVERNQAVILERIETHTARMASIEKAADLQNNNTAQIAAVLEKLAIKLDGIDGKIEPRPPVKATKPQRRGPPKLTANNLQTGRL